jgi:hypothetical protein
MAPLAWRKCRLSFAGTSRLAELVRLSRKKHRPRVLASQICVRNHFGDRPGNAQTLVFGNFIRRPSFRPEGTQGAARSLFLQMHTSYER